MFNNKSIYHEFCYKGSIHSENEIPNDVKIGWQYHIDENGTYKNIYCRKGDLLIKTEKDWVLMPSDLDEYAQKKKIYLASPYTSNDPEIMKYRCECVQKLAAKLMEEDNIVFSPVAHSHGIAQFMSSEKITDVNFWLEQDLYFLNACDEVYIFCLDGWKESEGIKKEIEYAREKKKLIHYLDSEGNEISKEILGKTF